MATLVLEVLLILLLLQSLLKFAIHFFVKYETRIQRINAEYKEGARLIAWFDDVNLILMVILLGLLLISGKIEYLSLTTGLVVGMTLIQVYFHRFQEPLAPDRSPKPPYRPVQLMSYAIQANPSMAWKEYLLMAVVIIWILYALLTQAFASGAIT